MDNRFDKYRVKLFLTGDSITEGDGNASAYRYQLFRRLYADGLPFAFVGANTSGDLRLPKAYRSHGGHCGFVIGHDDCAAGSLRGKMTEEGYRRAAADADIILLWIGYNDYGRKDDLEHITDSFTDLVAQYHAVNPDVTLFAMTLFDYNHKDCPLNNWLLDPATPAALEARFPGLTFRAVDINQPQYRLCTEDLDFPEDDGHPNERGNALIGACWFDAVKDTVRAMSEAKPAEEAAPVRAAAVTGDLHDTVVRTDGTVTFAASVLPADAEVTTILWSSSDTTVAVVDDYGLVRAIAPGETVITASSLDGGYALKARVTVLGGPLDLEQGDVLFRSDFHDGSWTGSDDVISPNFNKLALRWNKTKTGALSAAQTVSLPDAFTLGFTLQAANDRTHGRGCWLEVRVGSLALRVNGDAGVTELLENGETRGEKAVFPPVARRDRFVLTVKGNTAVVTRNAEFAFAATVSAMTGDAAVSVVWNEMTKSDLLDVRVTRI